MTWLYIKLWWVLVGGSFPELAGNFEVYTTPNKHIVIYSGSYKILEYHQLRLRVFKKNPHMLKHLLRRLHEVRY